MLICCRKIRRKDNVLYQHFHSQGHSGLEHMSVQLIDRVKGERELRDKEGQWIYKLGTLLPYGLNDNDGFMPKTRRHVGVRARAYECNATQYIHVIVSK